MPLTDQEFTNVLVYISESSTRIVISGSYTFLRNLSGSMIFPYFGDFPPFPIGREVFWHTVHNTLYRRNSANTAWVALSGSGSGGITSISGTNYGTGSGVFSSVSGSDTLNFRKLQGIGGTLVSTSGDTIQISSSVGGDGNVDSVFGRTGSITAQPSDYDASQIDNDSNVTGDFVDDALNTLSSSQTYLSGVVAIDITNIETSLTNLSTSVATDINSIETSITSLSISVASDINFLENSITALSTSVAFDINFLESSITNLSNSVALDINGIETSLTNLSNSVALDINSLETSITSLSASVASDINYLESSITNLSNSIASDINGIETSITSLSTSIASDINYINETIATLSASDITNDSNVAGSTVKDALNTLSASIVSGGLSSISGTNYGTGVGVYASVSGSNTLNFRTLTGAGSTTVSATGDNIEISSTGGSALYPPGFINGLSINRSPVLPSSSIIIQPGYCLSNDLSTNMHLSVSVAVSITGSGVNGLDTGTEQASKWYYVFLIYNPTTQVTNGLLSLSSTAPTMPSGYTKKRRIGVTRNNALSNFLGWKMEIKKGNERDYHYLEEPSDDLWLVSEGNSPIWTDVDCSHVVPPVTQIGFFNGAVGGYVYEAYVNTRPSGSEVFSPPWGIFAGEALAPGTGYIAGGTFFKQLVSTGSYQKIQYMVSPGTTYFNLWVIGFRDSI